MAENTKISWADNTWNPWQGCKKVSPGCANCYMYRDKKRYGQDPATVIRSKPPTFNKPLHWKDPAKVFVCSWSDFFIEDADQWRDDAWKIMRQTPHLTYLLLTKRPENIKDRLPEDWPLPNVWLGVTAENQEMADKRIPILLSIEAPKHFISIEPMVGPVDLFFPAHPNLLPAIDRLDWVIVGGESGPNARPCHPDWIRSLRDQCQGHGVPFMFKQWGEYRPAKTVSEATLYPRIVTNRKDGWCANGCYHLDHQVESMLDGTGRFSHIDCAMTKVGAKKSGHLLDGKEYMEFPEDK